MKRKSFLTATMVGATDLTSAPPAIPPWMQRPGNALSAYGVPSAGEREVVRRPSGTPSPTFTPLEHQLAVLTPNGLCFSRNHAGVPTIEKAEHRLLVHGLVQSPRIFTVNDVMRFPSVTRFLFIECSGNSAPGWERYGSSVQFSHGLLSCCAWTGVPLRTLLEEVGATPEGRWVVAEGADAAAFDRSLPLTVLDEALVAYGQNGEMLRPEQGYPLRLVVPGAEGSVNVKWLRRLKVTREPVYSREETVQYGRPTADAHIRVFDFILGVKSVITEPSPTRRMDGAGHYQMRGFAWSGHGRIKAVDVTFDGGRSWTQARLEEPNLPACLVRFSAPFDWRGEEVPVASRATDDTGAVQPTFEALASETGGTLRYHVNAIQSWLVASDGAVTGAHAR